MSRFANLWRRAILVLVIAIAILQVIHMVLVNRLEAVRAQRNRRALASTGAYQSQPTSPLEADTDSTFLPFGAYTEENLMHDRADLIRNIAESAVLDATGHYHIINFLSRGTAHSASPTSQSYHRNRNIIRPDLALVSHSSIPNIYNLLDILERWSGPVSVALFATDTVQVSQALEATLLLKRCSAKARQNVTFHLVYPYRREFNYKLTDDAQQQSFQSISDAILTIDCNNQTAVRGLLKMATLMTSDASDNDRGPQQQQQTHANYQLPNGFEYPNNLLRNVARRNSLCEYVLVIDIDLIPSAGLYQSFMDFARERLLFSPRPGFTRPPFPADPLPLNSAASKTVYVIPTFEMNISSTDRLVLSEDQLTRSNHKLGPDNKDQVVRIPRNKRDLIAAYSTERLRPFYIELCWKCQMHTDYETWMSQPATNRLDILYEVLWQEPWEPFYIGPNQLMPAYDERFRQYGFNRISQLCELYMAGYKFSILNNPFLIHKGLKRPGGFHESKDLEQERNRANYRQFKSILKERYPDSTRRCY